MAYFRSTPTLFVLTLSLAYSAVVGCSARQTSQVPISEVGASEAPSAQIPSAPESAKSERTTLTDCAFPNAVVSENVALWAISSYGGTPLDYEFQATGRGASLVDLQLHSPDRPIVIFLGGYESIIWNISWSRDTRIEAVIASGYYEQGVAGIPSSLPVLASTLSNRSPCGYFFFSGDPTEENMQGASDELQALAAMSQHLFGRDIELLARPVEGHLRLGAPPAGTKFHSAATPTIESFFAAHGRRVGRAGIEDALNAGKIRHATSQDIARWKINRGRSMKPPIPTNSSASAEQIAQYIVTAFVVLKPFNVPADLAGGHSVQFLIPEGVPTPLGALGHSTLFFLKDGSCLGSVPGCELPDF